MTRNRTMLRFLMVGAALVIAAPAAAQVTPPCCSITAIQTVTGVVSAKVKATGDTFAFKVTNRRTLTALKVGQSVYANFTTHQVSIDGRSACCTVTSGPAAPRAATATAPAPPPPPRGQPPANPAAGATTGTRSVASGAAAAISLLPPSITYGTPQQPSHAALAAAATVNLLPRYETRTIAANVNGHMVSNTILHVRGLDGIEQAPGLPEGARRLLKMHVRTLAPGESDQYIINVELANKWFSTHPPVPDDIQPVAEDHNTHSGCHSFSWHCAQESAAHAADQAQHLIDQSRDAWNHASDELAGVWNTVQSCFADATLPLPDVPVKFSANPGMSVTLSQSSSGSSNGLSTSSSVQGTLSLSFPMQSDVTAELDLFYIPCLPFVVRPKQISNSGTLTLGEELSGKATAAGAFSKTFTIPPTGGPRIPIEVIPIVIAGVPVAEMDVSAYIEGNVRVSATGQVDAQFDVKNPHRGSFAFACSGHGCSGTSHGIPDPTTATESADIKGTLTIQPDIFTALQLDFDFDALSARAGLEPYLVAQAAGCAGANAAQSSNGTSSSSENHVLAADLDWGVDLRAEALVANKIVGSSYRQPVTAQKHLWWHDLAPGGSTALDALVVAPATAAAAHKEATYKVRMPSCYPYTTPVTYHVTWTGNATPAANTACHWQSTGGTCTFDPGKDLLIGMTWPAGGSYSLSVQAIGDRHDNMTRVFAPAPRATSVNVAVSP
ncbi:MAG: hypothetical protein ACREL5_02170 [Gemmatimonadales bacterium]